MQVFFLSFEILLTSCFFIACGFFFPMAKTAQVIFQLSWQRR